MALLTKANNLLAGPVFNQPFDFGARNDPDGENDANSPVKARLADQVEMDQPMDQPMEQPANQLVEQSAKQPVEQPAFRDDMVGSNHVDVGGSVMPHEMG